MSGTAATLPDPHPQPHPQPHARAATGFGLRDGITYGAIGLPLAFLALPLYVTLPHHYAVQHGLPLALLGGVLLGTRLLDAVADPFIGQAIDRRFARGGQTIGRWAGAGAVVLAAAFTGLFYPPVSGRAALLAWLIGALLMTYLAFSLLTVLHQSWGTRLGGDEARRARIVAWREGFGLVGVLLASVLPALAGLGATCALLAASLAAGVWLLGRAPAPQPTPGGAVATIGWTAPWSDPRFRGLLGVFMLNGIASAVPATLVLFFVQDRLQAAAWTPAFLGAYFAAAVLSLPAWLALVRYLGLAGSWLAGMLLSVLAFAGAGLLGPGDEHAFLAVCIASGIALGADLALPGALLNGIVQRGPHGLRGAGAYAGWWTAATKLNLGLAAGAALPVLGLAGYAPGARDAASLQVLGMAYVALPCALKLAAAALLWRWHAHQRRNDA
jgi:GPH family glycoside/pentoside/hexuronide:cation symporter